MSPINKLSQLDLNETYSYADYLTWQFDETVELIKGKIQMMSPAPNVLHQSISWYFTGTLFNYFVNKSCRAFAPDWIIEILSAGNSKRETQEKFTLYQESGVKEYWIVYPYEQSVHQFVLNEQTEKYELITMYSGEDKASPALFPDLLIDLVEVFAE